MKRGTRKRPSRRKATLERKKKFAESQKVDRPVDWVPPRDTYHTRSMDEEMRSMEIKHGHLPSKPKKKGSQP